MGWPCPQNTKVAFIRGALSGKRSQGGQKSRFKDTLKASLKSLDINVDTWEDVAQDRMSWRHSIFEGCQVAEKRRIAEAQRKREQRKTRPTKQLLQTLHMSARLQQDVPCPNWPYKSHSDTSHPATYLTKMLRSSSKIDGRTTTTTTTQQSDS